MSTQLSLFSSQLESPMSLSDVLKQERLLEIKKGLVIEQALKSNDVEAIYQAQAYLKQIEQREVVASKSILVDPLELSSSLGYRDKPFQLSYTVLKAMAKTHIIKAIIETRKDQVAAFCEPQRDKFSTGFTIRKKKSYIETSEEKKLTKAEEKKIEWLIEFLLNCGTTSNFWHSDTFDDFIRKIVQDSLTYDQATFENVTNKRGQLVEFFATDGSTYRIADSYNDEPDDKDSQAEQIKGYAPAYVQLYMGEVKAEFYPWELCFGVRNPQTDIRYNGYGKSELEDMITIVTGILNADNYNANFFKVGSAPKGILRYSGNVNQNTLEDFKRQWLSQVTGALNAHRIPVINADKMDFINTHIPNKDMEFSKYHEFLIKIACAIYKIDPSEVGFNMSGSSSGNNGLGGDATAEKVKFSRDKGLKPLLKKIQFWINKYIISRLDPEYEFRFVGIENEMDEQTELDRDILMLQNFMTLNELRAKRNMDPIEGGDVPLNPVFLQAMGMAQQQQQMEAQGGGMGGDMGMEEDGAEDASAYIQDNDDPFMKSLNSEIEMLIGSN